MIKEVIEWVDVNSKEYDVRSRSDIDTGQGFTRLGDGRVAQVLIGTGTIRIYTSKFVGEGSIADSHKEYLEFGHKSLGFNRSPLSQS